jgi:hypothetical protein
VEGFLVLYDPTLAKRFDRVLYLGSHTNAGGSGSGGENGGGRVVAFEDVLAKRKWERSRGGRPSFKELGVPLDQYQSFWQRHVHLRHVEFGLCSSFPALNQASASTSATLVPAPATVPSTPPPLPHQRIVVDIDCCQPLEQIVAQAEELLGLPNRLIGS